MRTRIQFDTTNLQTQDNCIERGKVLLSFIRDAAARKDFTTLTSALEEINAVAVRYRELEPKEDNAPTISRQETEEKRNQTITAKFRQAVGYDEGEISRYGSMRIVHLGLSRISFLVSALPIEADSQKRGIKYGEIGRFAEEVVERIPKTGLSLEDFGYPQNDFDVIRTDAHRQLASWFIEGTKESLAAVNLFELSDPELLRTFEGAADELAKRGMTFVALGFSPQKAKEIHGRVAAYRATQAPTPAPGSRST